MNYVVGIDVGGTFTDLICIDESGNTIIRKVPSTPADSSLGVMDGLGRIAVDLGKTREEFFHELVRVCHGTTVSTNTILTWTGAKVGLLVTRGFRDLLTIRLRIRENTFDYTVPQPKPLAPRYLTIPIEERVKWNGEEYCPLNEEEVRNACGFFKEMGVEAVAICFLWSFKNPSHERRALEICKEELPDLYICSSYDVQPEIREYWRMSTTVINAYVGPGLSNYIRHLSSGLKKNGFHNDLLITQSNSGVISPEIACEQAVRTVLSGPSSAPGAASFISKPIKLDNLITIDMGGTSLDVCLVKQGIPTMTLESAVGGVYHMRLPMVDVRTIGAGGGSIAWLDRMNVLHVGPRSAGADPGPACYGKSGKEPTLTDANLVLGYLNAGFFLGGEIPLDIKLGEKSIREKIADPLGIDLYEAAKSIVTIADHTMVDEISAVSVQRGEDPREYTMVAAGGAGPVHVARLAMELGIRQVLIPRNSSIFCALGSVIADIRHDFVKSISVRTDSAEFSIISKSFNEMMENGNEYLEREGIAKKNWIFSYHMDMKYKGQFREVSVPISPDELNTKGMEEIIERFHQMHENLYAYRDETVTEIVNLRLTSFGKVTKPSRNETEFVSKASDKHVKGSRKVYFEETGSVDTPIYNGDAMESGNVLEGPAIVEQVTTTIVVPPRIRLEMNRYMDFMMYLPDKHKEEKNNDRQNQLSAYNSTC